jgi:hypothetical protein
MEDETGWIRIGRLLSWLVAACFLVAAVMNLLLEFDITASKPEAAPADLVDGTLAVFRNEQMRWPQELSFSLLFALGFAALAGLGILLARFLGRSEAPASLASATFVAAGTLGVGAMLLYLGAKQVAIDPHYCDCKYAPEQIISQSRGLALAEGSQRWLLTGFVVLAGLGFYQLARLSLERGVFSTGWARLTQALAVVLVLGLVSLVPRLDRVFEVVVFLGAAILLPLWAVWLDRQLAVLAVSRAAVDEATE